MTCKLCRFHSRSTWLHIYVLYVHKASTCMSIFSGKWSNSQCAGRLKWMWAHFVMHIKQLESSTQIKHLLNRSNLQNGPGSRTRILLRATNFCLHIKVNNTLPLLFIKIAYMQNHRILHRICWTTYLEGQLSTFLHTYEFQTISIQFRFQDCIAM